MESSTVSTGWQDLGMASQELLLPGSQRDLLASLIGQSLGGVASENPSFRDSWDASFGLFVEVGEGLVKFEAAWVASQDDQLADELASFSVTAGDLFEIKRLSTWYHWWHGETIHEVLLVTDEVIIERAEERPSCLVHDIGVVLICDIHAIAISLSRNLEFPKLIVGHELVEDGRPRIHTHPGVNSLSDFTTQRVTHARSVVALDPQTRQS